MSKNKVSLTYATPKVRQVFVNLSFDVPADLSTEEIEAVAEMTEEAVRAVRIPAPRIAVLWFRAAQPAAAELRNLLTSIRRRGISAQLGTGAAPSA